MRMKVCKVKPDADTCMTCVDIEPDWDWDMFSDCEKCPYATTDYELLSIGVGTMFRRDYAMILKDGKVQRVPLNRVYDIREV